MSLHNLAKMTTTTTGSGTITLGSASSGYLTFVASGVTDGEIFSYGIIDGTNSEAGQGTYGASGSTLTRTTILNSTNSGSPISLSGTATVFITALAQDFITGSGVANQLSLWDATKDLTGNSNLSYDGSYNNLLIGHNASLYSSLYHGLQIAFDDNSEPVTRLLRFGSTGTNDGGIRSFFRGSGSLVSPSPLLNNINLGILRWIGLYGTDIVNQSNIGAEIRVDSTENWSSGSSGVLMKLGATPAGSNNLGYMQFDGNNLTIPGKYYGDGSALTLASSGVTSGSYNKILVDTYGRVTAGSIVDYNLDLLQFNNSGCGLSLGMTVVRDSTVDNGFKLTTKKGDPSLCGILPKDVIYQGYTNLVSRGAFKVLTSGCIVRGHWLVSASTAGLAVDSGTIQKPIVGGLGIALTSASTTGSVVCDINIDPYASSAVLQMLPSKAQGTWSSGNTLSFTQPVDSGTDLLTIFTLGNGNTPPTSITAAGTGMTLLTAYNYTTMFCGGGQLRTPAINNDSIVLTYSGNPSSAFAIAINLVGSNAAPIRSQAAGTNISQNVTVVAGDIIFDIIKNDTALTPASGQTVIWNPASGKYFSYLVATTSGTLTLAWTGTNNAAAHGTYVLSGS